MTLKKALKLNGVKPNQNDLTVLEEEEGNDGSSEDLKEDLDDMS